jgi:hypothetical protein
LTNAEQHQDKVERKDQVSGPDHQSSDGATREINQGNLKDLREGGCGINE